jgi:CRISPR-associated exonuclease Cas4
MENTLDPINVSALNQYAYCPRRCGLIYLEGEFADNLHTQRGNAEHERVDRTAHATSRDGARVEYALPIWSDTLGLIGKCDVVEFWPDGTVYPVEYKHGPRRAWLNDDLQLAAQALCLEEMLGTTIEQGAIFHAGSQRRREIDVTAALRAEVANAVAAIRELLSNQCLPEPTTDTRRCRECSMKDICQPEAARMLNSGASQSHDAFEPDAAP